MNKKICKTIPKFGKVDFIESDFRHTFYYVISWRFDIAIYYNNYYFSE